MKQTLSVIIICQNEEDRIRDCLESVKEIADEIVIFDSGSTDGTISICRQYTDIVFETEWPGFGAQKQRALDKATGDWVLSIDADERITRKLAERIRHIVDNETLISAYRVKIIAEVYGKPLRHGRTSKFGWRLFRRKGASFNQKRIHEHVVPAPGAVSRLHEQIVHETYRDYRHAMAKFDRYAWDWAVEQFEKGRRVNSGTAVLRALAMFFRCYVLKRGFLDGQHGLVMACQFAGYTFNKYAALWYLNRQTLVT